MTEKYHMPHYSADLASFRAAYRKGYRMGFREGCRAGTRQGYQTGYEQVALELNAWLKKMSPEQAAQFAACGLTERLLQWIAGTPDAETE